MHFYIVLIVILKLNAVISHYQENKHQYLTSLKCNEKKNPVLYIFLYILYMYL